MVELTLAPRRVGAVNQHTLIDSQILLHFHHFSFLVHQLDRFGCRSDRMESKRDQIYFSCRASDLISFISRG